MDIHACAQVFHKRSPSCLVKILGEILLGPAIPSQDERVQVLLYCLVAFASVGMTGNCLTTVPGAYKIEATGGKVEAEVHTQLTIQNIW